MATSVPVVGGSIGGSTGTSTTATSITLAYSSLGTISAGDIIIAFGVNAEPAGFSVPSGYTSDYNITSAFGNSDGCAIACHKTTVTGTETGNLSLAWSGAGGGAGAMIRVATGSSITNNTNITAGTASTVTAPTPTSTSPGATDLVVRCYLFANDIDGSSEPTGLISNPSGWTNAANTDSTSTNRNTWNCGVSLNYLQAGTSTPAVTRTPSKSGEGGAWMVTEYRITGPTIPSGIASLSVVNFGALSRASFY
jgi:hypothetical protein